MYFPSSSPIFAFPKWVNMFSHIHRTLSGAFCGTIYKLATHSLVRKSSPQNIEMINGTHSRVPGTFHTPPV